MKQAIKFLIMAGVIVLATFLKFNTIYTDYGRIDSVGQADIETEIWYEDISSDINVSGVSLVVDEDVALDNESGIYIDENLNLMVPVSKLRDTLDCSAHIYENERVLVQKYENDLEAEVGEDTAKLNGENVSLGSAVSEIDGEYYVPIAYYAQVLGYSYRWNPEKCEIELSSLYDGVSTVPAKFDLRDYMRTSGVRDQGKYGTCWAFAALSSLESSIRPERAYLLSVDHMSIQSNFSIRQDTGGAYTMSLAYLTAWEGPVFEEDDPYGDGVSTDGLSEVLHVQEARLIDEGDFEAIKKAVFKYGAVQCSIYNDLRNAESYSDYYSRKNSAYCYTGSSEVNHEVVIVGWDDNYPKENFSVEVPGDGAFICQNSWGDKFGEDGYFYISYYDNNIGKEAVVFTRVEDTDNYDHIYQADLCGWVGQIGYNKESAYGANIYLASGNETIDAVGFYATGRNTSYEVYVVPEFTDAEDLQVREMEPDMTGTLSDPGYYTIDLDKPVNVNEGDNFVIIIKLIVPNGSYPMAVEYYADELTRSVTLKDGWGYVSANGREWESTEETYGCNLCIKAYSSDR